MILGVIRYARENATLLLNANLSVMPIWLLLCYKNQMDSPTFCVYSIGLRQHHPMFNTLGYGFGLHHYCSLSILPLYVQLLALPHGSDT